MAQIIKGNKQNVAENENSQKIFYDKQQSASTKNCGEAKGKIGAKQTGFKSSQEGKNGHQNFGYYSLFRYFTFAIAALAPQKKKWKYRNQVSFGKLGVAGKTNRLALKERQPRIVSVYNDRDKTAQSSAK